MPLNRYLAPPTWLALAALVFVPLAAGAASVTDTAPFSTAGQSIWGPGEAVIFDYEEFVGVSWNESSGTLGGDAWAASAYATFFTEGRIGPEVSLHLNTGSVDVSYPVSVSLEFPEQVAAGETFTVSSSYSAVPGYSMTTASPSGSAYAGFVVEVSAGIDGYWWTRAGCGFLGTSTCSGPLDTNLLSIDESYDLINVDSGVPWTKPLDGYGTITAQIPTVATTGSLVGNNLVSTGRGDIVELELDLDAMISAIPGVPDMHFDIDLEVADMQGDLLSAYANLGLDLEQSFEFAPELMVTLDLGSGDSIEFLAGESVEIVMPDLSVLSVDPSYALANAFSADTDLVFEGGIGLDVLSGSFDTIVTSREYFGPLFHTGLSGDLADFDLLADSWTLGGFGVLGGTPFSIAGMPPSGLVPEPGALMLFAVGATLVARATRRRTSWNPMSTRSARG